MFEFEAYAVLKTKDFTIVNDSFHDKSNDEADIMDKHKLPLLFVGWFSKMIN